MDVVRPANYGTSCQAWDENLENHICATADAPSWCTASFCYVSEECTQSDKTPSSLADGLFYSYMTCGNAADFTDAVMPRDCE